MQFGADQQTRAVESGVWPLYRYDPRRTDQGEPPLVIDAPAGKIPVSEYMRNETRVRMVEKINPAGFKRFAAQAQRMAERRIAVYKHMADLRMPSTEAQESSNEDSNGSKVDKADAVGAAK